MTTGETERPSAAPTAPGRRFWIGSGLLYLLVNLPFLFLTLDTYNLNGEIYSSSYLYLGLNPYHAAINVGQGYLIIPGAGYFILPYNAIAFLAYPAFGFNAIATSALLKAIGLVAGFLAARIAYAIAIREAVPHPKSIFYAVLFNPFLIFVNSIAGDADLLVVFFVFLAVFLFRYGWKKPVHVPAVLLGAVAISLTALSYYFTLLLVPTLLLGIEGRRTKLIALALVATILLVFAVPLLVFGLGSNTPSSLVGPAQVSGYSFPYYLPHSAANFFGTNQAVFTGLAVVLAILIPLVFRRWGVGDGTTLLTVLAVAFALTFRLPFDVFSILAALVPLAFALSPSRRPARYGTILMFQAFLVPVYLLAELYNGPGQVSGVYYWLYPYLHQNTILYSELGGAWTAKLLFLVFAMATVVTIASLVWLERTRSRSGLPTPARLLVKSFPRAWTTPGRYIVAIALATLIVAVSLGLAVVPSSPASLESHQQLNSQEFYAYDIVDPLLYPLPGPATYSVDSSAGTVSIAGTSLPVGLARSISDTTNEVSFSVTANPSTNSGPIPLWQTNQTEILYSSMLAPPPDVLPWVPEATHGAPTSLARIPPINGSTLIYEVQGSDGIEYVEPTTSLVGNREFFAAESMGTSPSENPLWAWSFGPGGQVNCTLTGNILSLTVENGTLSTTVSTVSDTAPGQWFLSGFSLNSDSRTVSTFVNNVSLTLPLPPLRSTTVTIDLGALNQSASFGSNGAWMGNLSGVYSLTPHMVAFVPGFFASTTQRSYPTWVGEGNSTRIDYRSSPTGGSLWVNGTNLTFSQADSFLVFGKLGISPASLVFRVTDTSFVRAESGIDFEWLTLGFGVLLPLWLFAWGSRELWITLHRDSRT